MRGDANRSALRRPWPVPDHPSAAKQRRSCHTLAAQAGRQPRAGGLPQSPGRRGHGSADPCARPDPGQRCPGGQRAGGWRGDGGVPAGSPLRCARAQLAGGCASGGLAGCGSAGASPDARGGPLHRPVVGEGSRRATRGTGTGADRSGGHADLAPAGGSAEPAGTPLLALEPPRPGGLAIALLLPLVLGLQWLRRQLGFGLPELPA